MKTSVFFGLLACLSLVNARVTVLDSSFNSTVEEIRKVLEQFDPATVKDVSFTLLNQITFTLKSASLSKFSNFAFTTLSNDGENIRAKFSHPEVDAVIDSLKISSKLLGIDAGVPNLEASVGGLTIDVSLSYSTTPLRLTSLSALAQIADASVKGTASLNGNIIDISVGEEVVAVINKKAVEHQDKISAVIMKVANKILTVVHPNSH
ncbi:uncharacterized protein LOC108740094 [Agrilus planipennis]|uniref:Uncharacterized protein LOC108740094 n=1 Tax=Agrilus planipennis TaxID=224129 RepID=A0A1W4X123_AGRPL|nr:uncharacterized protein LOC108740094 [Agrilus planipennis]